MCVHVEICTYEFKWPQYPNVLEKTRVIIIRSCELPNIGPGN